MGVVVTTSSIYFTEVISDILNLNTWFRQIINKGTCNKHLRESVLERIPSGSLIESVTETAIVAVANKRTGQVDIRKTVIPLGGDYFFKNSIIETKCKHSNIFYTT